MQIRQPYNLCRQQEQRFLTSNFVFTCNNSLVCYLFLIHQRLKKDMMVEAVRRERSQPTQTKVKTHDKNKKTEGTIIKGKPKSGRVWKEPRQRFSSIVKTRGLRISREKNQMLRNDLQRIKEQSRAIIEQKKSEKAAKKQRRIENLKRAEENRKKSEVVQVIKNTAKIRRMKKKQIRMIEKRDTVNA